MASPGGHHAASGPNLTAFTSEADLVSAASASRGGRQRTLRMILASSGAGGLPPWEWTLAKDSGQYPNAVKGLDQ